jgi:phosphatidate cytidylyltransferase
MFRDRLLVSIVLTPLAFWLIFVGGIPYLLAIGALLGIAGWELSNLLRAGGFRPSGFLIVGGIIALLVGRYAGALAGLAFSNDSVVLALTIFVTTGYFVLAYEQGNSRAGTDMALTLGGTLYIGFLGGYLYLLRTLPDGIWWTMITLPAIWLVDSGAYLVGRQFGRHAFSPRISPKKTWEGYFGGIAMGAAGNALLCLGLQAIAGDPIAPSPWQAALIGLTLGLLTPLGDLGKSLFKRQVGLKDSGNLIPGHGGAFDRVDTWLWGSVIGYYLIVWFF